MRLVLFLIVTMLVGPFVGNPLLRLFRVSFFWYTLLIYVIIALVSFFGRFVGLSRTQGDFWCGITNHSMLLGIVAGNAGVYLVMLMTSVENLTSKQRWIIGLGLLLCFLMMLGASSRSSILAFLAGVGVVLFVSMKKHRTRIVKIAAVSFVIMSIISPLLDNYTKGIYQKNHGEITDLNLSSRVGLWEQTWHNFTENPLVGIGFSAMEIDTGELAIGNHNGQVEPGSSWLAVLSMTGLLGGISIVLILNKSYHQLRVIYINNVTIAAVLYGLLAFYCVHMCAEGYIFAGGSMSCLNFWLLLGTIDAYETDDNIFHNSLNNELILNRLLPLLHIK